MHYVSCEISWIRIRHATWTCSTRIWIPSETPPDEPVPVPPCTATHQLLPLPRSRDGQVSKKEFKQAWSALGGEPSEERIDALFLLIDKDKSGTIDYNEFHRAVRSIKIPHGMGRHPSKEEGAQTDLDVTAMENLESLQTAFNECESRAEAAETELEALKKVIADAEEAKEKQRQELLEAKQLADEARNRQKKDMETAIKMADDARTRHQTDLSRAMDSERGAADAVKDLAAQMDADRDAARKELEDSERSAADAIRDLAAQMERDREAARLELEKSEKSKADAVRELGEEMDRMRAAAKKELAELTLRLEAKVEEANAALGEARGRAAADAETAAAEIARLHDNVSEWKRQRQEMASELEQSRDELRRSEAEARRQIAERDAAIVRAEAACKIAESEAAAAEAVSLRRRRAEDLALERATAAETEHARMKESMQASDAACRAAENAQAEAESQASKMHHAEIKARREEASAHAETARLREALQRAEQRAEDLGGDLERQRLAAEKDAEEARQRAEFRLEEANRRAEARAEADAMRMSTLEAESKAAFIKLRAETQAAMAEEASAHKTQLAMSEDASARKIAEESTARMQEVQRAVAAEADRDKVTRERDEAIHSVRAARAAEGDAKESLVETTFRSTVRERAHVQAMSEVEERTAEAMREASRCREAQLAAERDRDDARRDEKEAHRLQVEAIRALDERKEEVDRATRADAVAKREAEAAKLEADEARREREDSKKREAASTKNSGDALARVTLLADEATFEAARLRKALQSLELEAESARQAESEAKRGKAEAKAEAKRAIAESEERDALRTEQASAAVNEAESARKTAITEATRARVAEAEAKQEALTLQSESATTKAALDAEKAAFRRAQDELSATTQKLRATQQASKEIEEKYEVERHTQLDSIWKEAEAKKAEAAARKSEEEFKGAAAAAEAECARAKTSEAEALAACEEAKKAARQARRDKEAAESATDAAQAEAARYKCAEVDAQSVAQAAIEEARLAQRVAEAAKDDADDARRAAHGAWRVADEMRSEADGAKRGEALASSEAHDARAEALDAVRRAEIEARSAMVAEEASSRLTSRIMHFHTGRELAAAPTIHPRAPQSLAYFMRCFSCFERHTHKKRREDLFHMFSVNGKAHITLPEALSGISTALTQAHGRQAIVVYRRYYRCFKWAFQDTRECAAQAEGRGGDYLSLREFRLFLLHLCVYATWYEVFAHIIIGVQPSTPRGDVAPPVPRRIDPFEYWSEVNHKFVREEWDGAIGRVREAGRTWAPYLNLIDASSGNFEEMTDGEYVDFRSFCSWVHAAEVAAATAVGLELWGPRDDRPTRFGRLSRFGSPPPARLRFDSALDERRALYLEDGPWSASSGRASRRAPMRFTSSMSGSTLSPPRRVSEVW